jgi:O-antigen/teichoic acid export membrane protein
MTREPGRADPTDTANDVFWRTRRWWRRVGQTSFATWISTAVAFAATIILARTLGPTEFGAVVLAVSVTTLIATFLDLTLEEAVVHHGYRLLEAGRMTALRALVRTSLTLDLLIGLAVAGVVIAAADPLAHVISGGRLDPTLVRLAALALLAATLDGTTGALLLLADRPDLRAWVLAGINLVRLCGIAAVLAMGGGATEVVAVYVLAHAVGAVGQALIAWRLTFRRWRDVQETSSGGRVGARALVSFAMHTSLAKTVFSARDMLFPVLLGAIAGPAAVGLFRVAMLPVFAAGLLSAPVRMVLLPEQNKLHAARRFDDLWRSIKLHIGLGFAVGAAGVAVGWFALAWLIPALYGSGYGDAVTASRILLIAVPFHLAVGWWKTLPAALGRPQLSSLLAVVSLAVTVCLLAGFASMGDEGAALAYTLEAVLLGIPTVIYTRRLLLGAAREPVAAAAPAEAVPPTPARA